MKRHKISFVSLIDFVVSIHAYQCMHLRQKHANLRNKLPGGMHGFRWATHWWGSSYYSPNHCTVHFHVKKDANLDGFFSQQVVAGYWNILCVWGAYSTRRKDASFFIGSAYSQSRHLMSPVKPHLDDLQFLQICLEHVCFRITCWFDSRKPLSRVKRFHRVCSLEVFMRFQRFSSKVSCSLFGNTSGKSILDTNFAAEGLVQSVGWWRRMLFPLLMAESYSIESPIRVVNEAHVMQLGKKWGWGSLGSRNGKLSETHEEQKKIWKKCRRNIATWCTNEAKWCICILYLYVYLMYIYIYFFAYISTYILIYPDKFRMLHHISWFHLEALHLHYGFCLPAPGVHVCGEGGEYESAGRCVLLKEMLRGMAGVA